MDKIRRLRFVGSRQSAVGKEKVASRRSPVASRVAFGNVIGYWIRVKCYVPSAKKGSVAKRRKPKPFTIHHSPFTKFTGLKSRIQSFSILHSPFSIPRKASF
ncbi:hypothetical protein [Nitratifractor sp.]